MLLLAITHLPPDYDVARRLYRTGIVDVLVDIIVDPSVPAGETDVTVSSRYWSCEFVHCPLNTNILLQGPPSFLDRPIPLLAFITRPWMDVPGNDNLTRVASLLRLSQRCARCGHTLDFPGISRDEP